MVEKPVCREGAPSTTAQKELRAEKQGWLSCDLRPLQRFHFKSHNFSHQTYDIRCPSSTVLESSASVGPHRWSTYSSNTTSTNKTRSQSCISTSIPQFIEYYDTEMDKQGNRTFVESRYVSHVEDVSVFGRGQIRWRDCERLSGRKWQVFHLGDNKGKMIQFSVLPTLLALLQDFQNIETSSLPSTHQSGTAPGRSAINSWKGPAHSEFSS